MNVGPLSGDELTIHELATRTGVSVRTIRFYAGRELLPPPLIHRRVGYYGPVHRARLELIRELQEHGYTLAAIERYFERIPSDAPEEDLALHRAMLAPWVSDLPEHLDLHDLERRAGRPLGAEELRVLTTLAVIEHLGDGRFKVAPAGLDISLQLLDLELPAEAILEAARVIGGHTSAIADGLGDVFRRLVWEPHRYTDSPQELAHLRFVVEKLRPLVVRTLVTTFQSAVNRLIRQTLIEAPGERSAPGDAGPAPGR